MARRPARQPSGGTGVPAPAWGGINPLVLTVFVIVAAFAILVAWLQLTYEEPPAAGADTILAEVTVTEPKAPAARVEASKPTERKSEPAVAQASEEKASPAKEAAPAEQATPSFGTTTTAPTGTSTSDETRDPQAAEQAPPPSETMTMVPAPNEATPAPDEAAKPDRSEGLGPTGTVETCSRPT